MQFRNLRIAKRIQEECNQTLGKEFDFHGALVTVTTVRVNRALDHAVIYLSVLPPDREPYVLSVLTEQQRHIRKKMMERIRIKKFPSIAFTADSGAANAARVEKILLEEENTKGTAR
ncbi:30S ribosome-binding factor RbfA [Candidatus Parcubacteria bacterium]|nr:MAG: 30S ribosome-binding factor RbfA [Candidatus Parcubacteria bacterium]